MIRDALLAIALLALAGCGGCKKTDEQAPLVDAAVIEARGPIAVQHPETGLRLLAPETWLLGESKDPDQLADLRRPSPGGTVTLAPPRIVVIVRAREANVDVERAIERELADLRTVQASGALSIARTTRARRLLGGVDMGELRVDYKVSDARGGPDAAVVHRVWVGGRTGLDGRPYEVLIVETHLAADEAWVAREVEDVLKNIQFVSPGSGEGERQP